MRQGFQPVLKPHHPQSETHRLQAFRLRDLREGLPEESGPPATQRNATLRDPPHTLNTLSLHSERTNLLREEGLARMNPPQERKGSPPISIRRTYLYTATPKEIPKTEAGLLPVGRPSRLQNEALTFGKVSLASTVAKESLYRHIPRTAPWGAPRAKIIGDGKRRVASQTISESPKALARRPHPFLAALGFGLVGDRLSSAREEF
ncbi:hypothetical protein CEXT_794551 [Caerostris extrusa]|uniref:Uncharacterized protein n=1 Tax=Caerostris extrusa TaxID=172846 RepID=A0AAV4WNT9_CAEEX|nr:hypothetical protein CEXT_794551 [Caerostris extrusa]